MVIEATEQKLGLLSAHMSCVPDSRECLHLPSWGMSPKHMTGDIHVSLNFEGQEIFKSAVKGMADSIAEVLEREGLSASDIDLFIPHQANVRIISAVGDRVGIDPEKVFINVQNYGNTSAASIPIAFDELARSGKLTRGQVVVFVAFGGGLTWGANVLRY